MTDCRETWYWLLALVILIITIIVKTLDISGLVGSFALRFCLAIGFHIIIIIILTIMIIMTITIIVSIKTKIIKY